MSDISEWVRLSVTSIVEKMRMNPDEAREFLGLVLELCLGEKEYELGMLEPALIRLLPSVDLLAPGSTRLTVVEGHTSSCIAVISRVAKKEKDRQKRSISDRLLKMVGLGTSAVSDREKREHEELLKNYRRLCEWLQFPQLPVQHGSKLLQALKQAKQDLTNSTGEQSP